MSTPVTAPRRTVSRAPLTTRRSRTWILVVTIVIGVIPLVASMQNLTLSTEVSPSLAAWSAVVWGAYTIPFLVIICRIGYF